MVCEANIYKDNIVKRIFSKITNKNLQYPFPAKWPETSLSSISSVTSSMESPSICSINHSRVLEAELTGSGKTTFSMTILYCHIRLLKLDCFAIRLGKVISTKIKCDVAITFNYVFKWWRWLQNHEFVITLKTQFNTVNACVNSMWQQVFTSEKWGNSIFEVDDGREELLDAVVLGGNKVTGLDLCPSSPSISNGDCSKKLDHVNAKIISFLICKMI